MAVTSNGDLYPPFPPPQSMGSEEGPQSSEDGSGMHSPVYSSGYSMHGDSLRYHDQVDVHHPAGMMAPQYDYTHTLNAQQPPILDTTSMELPNSSARHASFNTSAHHYPSVPRNHLGLESYSIQSPVSARIPSPAASPLDYPRYSAERPLPGGPSHDSSYTTRPIPTSSAIPMEPDHRPAPVPSAQRPDATPVTAHQSTSSREPRKELNQVIACRQCRSRKIRCDSLRPSCNNCLRRSNDCQYDAAPKRRGPDKNPGTRRRSCKRRPTDGSAPPPSKRVKRSASDRHSSTAASPEHRDSLSSPTVKENVQDTTKLSSSTSSRPAAERQQHPHLHQQQQQQQQHHNPQPLPARQPHPDLHYHPQHHHTQHMSIHPHHPHHAQGPPSPTDPRIMPTPDSQYKEHHELQLPYRRSSSNMYDQGSYTKSSYPRQLDVNTFPFTDPISRRTPPEQIPTSIVNDRKWWWDKVLRAYTPDQITQELQFLVENTGHILSFINVHYLSQRIRIDEARIYIEPSLILACLAMATLMKASVLEGGAIRRQDAISLANDAQSSFATAHRSGYISLSLVETALVLALFESSAHPQHTPSRAVNALITLDRIIMEFPPSPLTLADANDREASKFTPEEPPSVHIDNPVDPRHQKCNCIPLDAIQPADSSQHRTYVLPWDQHWGYEEIRAEETRRLCWSSLSLVSEYIAQCEALNENPPSFFLANPANFCLLFPGEVIDRASVTYRGVDSMSTKESVWALYCRSMLLWNFCNRFALPQGDEDRAEQANQAFQEVQAIEDGLNAHECNLDTTLMYTTREFIHNIRMLVAEALKGYLGYPVRRKSFDRKQAEEWLWYEHRLVQQVHAVVLHRLTTPDGYMLTRRPFRINWFINQLQISLALWKQDQTLVGALTLGKLILHIIDVLNALWQCTSSIETKTASLRARLIEACQMSHEQLPLTQTYTVPDYLRQAGQNNPL